MKTKFFILVPVSLMLFTSCSLSFEWDDDGEAANKEGSEIQADDEAIQDENAEDDTAEEDVEHKIARDQSDIKKKKNLEEDPSDIEIIEKYYDEISGGDLEAAYALRYEPSVTYTTYKGWYESTVSADPRDFEQLADHKYRFIVDLEDEGDKEERYRVVSEIKAGMINNISSVKSWDNYSVVAFSRVEDGMTSIYVRDKGEERFITSFRENDDISGGVDKIVGLRDGSLQILGNGQYLAYEIVGWEWAEAHIYDVDTGNLVHIVSPPAYVDYGFTNGNKYFYQCGESGLWGGQVKVYNVPSFTLKKDLAGTDSGDGFLIYGCYGYDSNTDIYTYSLSFDGFMTEVVRKYYFATGVIY